MVAEAADGSAAVELARQHQPDVVLMDIRMPVLDGIEATRRILTEDRPDTVRVVVLTTYQQDDYIADALRAGASGFLLKGSPIRRPRQPQPVARTPDAVAGSRRSVDGRSAPSF